jgi:hypothetical protein
MTCAISSAATTVIPAGYAEWEDYAHSYYSLDRGRICRRIAVAGGGSTGRVDTCVQVEAETSATAIVLSISGADSWVSFIIATSTDLPDLQDSGWLEASLII